MRKLFLITIVFIVLAAAAVSAQSTEFTYQGRLQAGAIAATGNYDFEFSLFDAIAAGSQIGTTIGLDSVNVSNGIFSVRLDFGSAFPGPERFIEIRIRQSGGGTFETLAPRQRITSSPYAVRSLNADSADTADSAITAATANVANVATTAGNVTGIIQIANGGTGSTTKNFVDLTNAQTIAGIKTFSDSISGNAVNSLTEYRMGGNRVLSVSGNANVFGGLSTGTNNIGSQNSFFGSRAGSVNTDGNSNSFVGASAGSSNIVGSNNSFFGSFAGPNNTSGAGNSFLGRHAGFFTTTGSNNTFVGMFAGRNNTVGAENTFLGRSAGSANTTGSNNTLIGNESQASAGLNFATALGSGAVVFTSNTIVLGRTSDTVLAPNLLQVNTLGAAGSTSLCRNTLEQISTCTAGNISDKTAELELRIEAQAKEIETLKAEILANRKLQADLVALRKFICVGNLTVEVCKQ